MKAEQPSTLVAPVAPTAAKAAEGPQQTLVEMP
jgi:hypothetical protein